MSIFILNYQYSCLVFSAWVEECEQRTSIFVQLVQSTPVALSHITWKPSYQIWDLQVIKDPALPLTFVGNVLEKDVLLRPLGLDYLLLHAHSIVNLFIDTLSILETPDNIILKFKALSALLAEVAVHFKIIISVLELVYILKKIVLSKKTLWVCIHGNFA